MALAVLLALTVCLRPAQADDEKKSKEPIPGSGPLLAELIRDQNAADAIVRGVIQEKKHFRASPIGLPATRYRMTGKWSKPAREELAPLEFWVPGGRDSRDRVLIPSKGYYDLTVGDPYIVLAHRRTDGVFVLMNVFQRGQEPDTRREIVVDAEGYVLGVDTAGRLRRSLSVFWPALNAYHRRQCAFTRPPHPDLPRGEKGLKAYPFEAEQAFAPMTALPFNSLPGSGFEGGSSGEPEPIYDQCQDCYPNNPSSNSNFNVTAWVDDTIRFYCHDSLDIHRLKLLRSCFRSWNHVAVRAGVPGPSLFAEATDAPPAGLHPAFHGDGRSGIAFMDPEAGEIQPPNPYSLYDTACSTVCDGVCNLWLNYFTGRFIEADILINTNRSGRQEFLRTAAHELGHALTLGHECGYVSILPPGTDTRVPRAKGTPDYVRLGDYDCVRKLLREFNTRAGTPDPWYIPRFRDMGSVASYHPEVGQACRAWPTYIEGHRGWSQVEVPRGGKLTIMGVHLENRGLLTARSVLLTFFIRRGRKEYVIGRYRFCRPFRGWHVASYEVRMPRVALGVYNLGWRVSHPLPDKAKGNNTAWLIHSNAAAPQPLMTVKVVLPNP